MSRRLNQIYVYETIIFDTDMGPRLIIENQFLRVFKQCYVFYTARPKLIIILTGK